MHGRVGSDGRGARRESRGEGVEGGRARGEGRPVGVRSRAGLAVGGGGAIKGVRHGLRPRPGGAHDNSPTLQRWVTRSGEGVPEGRMNSCAAFARPFGTELFLWRHYPTLKRWAILGRPFGTRRRRDLTDHREGAPMHGSVGSEGRGSRREGREQGLETNLLRLIANQRNVAQASKPAVSPISKSAGRRNLLGTSRLETCHTADLEICATTLSMAVPCAHGGPMAHILLQLESSRHHG